MLYEFLHENQAEILELTERKSMDLAGLRPSSEQLKRGLPMFYNQLLKVLQLQQIPHPKSERVKEGMAKAAGESDEPAMAMAAGRPDEIEIARAAGVHGTELLRLGYTLSHVVHAFGAMCESIMELAAAKAAVIGNVEFGDLNRCLDIAIAGAVTEYQSLRNTENISREVEHLGILAHELRNATTTVTMALQLIKNGTVGFTGSTGKVLDRGLRRIQELIDRSLTEVRLRVEPKNRTEPVQLLQLIDQIVVTAEIEARSRDQHLEIQVDPTLVFESDQQLAYSAASNLIQNALKYTRTGGTIMVRGYSADDHVVLEVEDECGGLLSDETNDLFKPYVQKHGDRSGMGLGLTIAQRAVAHIHGTIEAHNLVGKGCIFKITLPKKARHGQLKAEPAA